MNEFDTLTDLVGSSVIDLIQSFADEQIENFADQIRYLDLDPKKDFRYSDLSFMSFGDCDLRGFDFTGSNLTGVTGTGAKWDHTTKLDDANLTASIFSYYQHSHAYFESNPNSLSELKRLKANYWTKSILWVADSVGRGHAGRTHAIEISKALFETVDDMLVKSNILYFLSYAFDNRLEHRDFLIYTINKHPSDTKIIRASVGVLSTLFTNDHATVCLLQNLAANIDMSVEVRRLAIRGIISSANFKSALNFIKNDGEIPAVDLRRQFTRRVASMRGQFSVLASTEPRGDVAFDFASEITVKKIEGVALRILSDERIMKIRSSGQINLAHHNIEPSIYDRMNLAVEIRDELVKIRRDGVPFRFASDVGQMKKINPNDLL